MSRSPSKNNRALGLIALMGVMAFVVGGAASVVGSGEVSSLATAKARLASVQEMTSDLLASVVQEQTAVDDYVFSASASALTTFTDAVAREEAVVARISQPAGESVADVVTALEELEAANLDWKTQVATRAIRAVGLHDTAAIGLFGLRAAQDHARVDAAVAEVNQELARAKEAVARQEAAAGQTSSISIVVAFGFLIIAFGVALIVVRRFGRALERDAREASVLNQFTDLTSFADSDPEVAAKNLVALGRLVAPDASVVHLLNRSQERAVPEASTGDAVAEVLPLRALDRCAGVLRGSMFVVDDLSDDLSAHCPVYPAAVGTLACVPLDSGELVGSVHLYWRRPNALPFDRRPSVARITEHAALSIGNRRLLAALHGQANTDARTGLANTRAFDLAFEAALAARIGHEPLAILMLDVDHFKQFNDRQGHPAGDEALKAFAAVLRSCMREGDTAARYGGEEFAVLLKGADGTVAATVAERIRARTEATIISLGPGITDHITVSIGISVAPDQGLDRVNLMHIADEALYRAKEAGRNRVVGGKRTGPPLPSGASASGPKKPTLIAKKLAS